MSPLAVVLILISCFMHAGWNLLVRHGRSEGAFIKRMLLITVMVGAAPAVGAEFFYGGLPATAWLCALA